jgi:hypothetical protein
MNRVNSEFNTLIGCPVEGISTAPLLIDADSKCALFEEARDPGRSTAYGPPVY